VPLSTPVYRACEVSAETLREVGILVLVFGLLDERFRLVESQARNPTEQLHWGWIAAVLVFGLVPIAAGIWAAWLLEFLREP